MLYDWKLSEHIYNIHSTHHNNILFLNKLHLYGMGMNDFTVNWIFLK